MNDLSYNKNNLSEKIIYWLIIILPFSLISGPFLSDLSISIITVLFVYISYENKYYFFYNNKYSKIFGLFVLILLITSFFSIDPLVSFKKTLFFFRFWIFALAVWYIFSFKKEELCNRLIITFSIAFIVLIVDGYIQFFLKKNIFGWPMYGTRLSSLFGDELILGSYLSRMLPLFFGLLVYINFSKKIYHYIIFFIIFVGVETLIFLSGERVAFFYVNASTLMLILTMRNFKLFRISAFIVSIFIIFALVNIYPDSSKRIVDKTVKQLGFEQEKKTNTKELADNEKITSKRFIFSIEHQNHYISSIRMFKDNIVSGIGPRMFRFICGEEKYYLWEGCSTHPHNSYVQLLAETGLIGFIFGLTVFVLIFYNIIKHFILKFYKKKFIYSDFQLCLLSAILISIWPFVPTGDLFNNWLNIIYFFPVGFYLSSIYSKNKTMD